jgi:aspartate-semialdehyde dehydrogenase
MSSQPHIAILGATGAVGVEVLKTLEKRNFPVGKLTLLASERSVGKKMKFRNQDHTVQLVTADAFKGVNIAIFSAGATRSREFAPHAIKAGGVVVDNSSAFRMDPSVPLVVPEVNPGDLKTHKGIIANPNCSAAIMAVPLWPLHQKARIRRIVVSTYQAASGAGAKAMEELETQAKDVLAGRPVKKEVLPHQIAFNVFSHNTKIADNGLNEEENKIVEETRKMFHEPNLAICPTCIRVPVFRAHSESILIETERKLTAVEARAILSKAPGVKLVDNRETNYFPMPIEASGEYDVLVGRLREDPSCENGLVMFVSGDQLLKGAALNAVQIAEMLLSST